VRQHPQRPLEVQSLADRLVERLPGEPVHIKGHERPQRRGSPAPGLEGVQAAEQPDPGSAFHAAEDRPQVFGPQGRRIEVADQVHGVLLVQRPGQIHRPVAPLRGVDQFVIHLHLRDRGQGPAQPGLLESRRALEVQDPQPAIDDVDERRQLVVGDDDLPVEPVHNERQFAFAHGLGSPGEPHRLLTGFGAGLDGRPRHLLQRAGVGLGEQPHDGAAPRQPLEPDAALDLERVPHRHPLRRLEVEDGRIPPLPRTALLPERDGPQRRPHVAEPAGRRLRRHVPGCIGLLRTVAEQDHAGERSAGQRPQTVVEGSADRGLVRRVGSAPLAERKGIVPDGGQGLEFAVEPPDGDVKSPLVDESAGHRPRRCQRVGHLAPPRPAPRPIGHGHALRRVGEHEHRPLLPGLLRGHERWSDEAQHDREEGRQPQEREHQHLLSRDPRPVGRDGQQHGQQRGRHEADAEPRAHRLELQGHLLEHGRGDHQPTLCIGTGGGTGGGPTGGPTGGTAGGTAGGSGPVAPGTGPANESAIAATVPCPSAARGA
jgi:hypothetical protein